MCAFVVQRVVRAHAAKKMVGMALGESEILLLKRKRRGRACFVRGLQAR